MISDRTLALHIFVSIMNRQLLICLLTFSILDISCVPATRWHSMWEYNKLYVQQAMQTCCQHNEFKHNFTISYYTCFHYEPAARDQQLLELSKPTNFSVLILTYPTSQWWLASYGGGGYKLYVQQAMLTFYQNNEFRYNVSITYYLFQLWTKSCLRSFEISTPTKFSVFQADR